jgi:hypothetical protein
LGQKLTGDSLDVVDYNLYYQIQYFAALMAEAYNKYIPDGFAMEGQVNYTRRVLSLCCDKCDAPFVSLVRMESVVRRSHVPMIEQR